MAKNSSNDINDFLNQIKRQLLGKFKIYTYIVTTLVVLALGYYYYQHFYIAPRNEEASLELSYSQIFFRQDSLDLALDGSLSSIGLLNIIDKYGNTDFGNLAKFYAADIYLKKKDYNNAIYYFEDYAPPNDFMKSRKLGLLADAYSEINDVENAVDNYYESYETISEDKYWGANMLYKGGCFALLNDNVRLSKKCFTALVNTYPNDQNTSKAINYLASMGVFPKMGKYE